MEFPDKSIFKSEDLIRHFIRGYFDGDGTLSFYDKEHKFPAIGFVGTEKFLLGLLKYIPEEFSSIKLHFLKNCSKMCVINYAHKKAFRLINYMYSNSSIYLDRKKEKYDYFCRSLEEFSELLQTNIGEG